MASKTQQQKKKSVKKSVKPNGATFQWWIPAVGAAVVLILAVGVFVGMMKLEETDTFCASCHTQPEAPFVERMAIEASDTASAHQSKTLRGSAVEAGVHCIDCHSGPGLGGRAAAMLLGARNAWLYLTKTMVQPAVLSVPIADENCLKCHAEVIAAESYKGQNNHYHYFLARWRQALPDQAASCTECHKSHSTDVEANLKFLNRVSTEAICNRCHTTLRGDD